MYEKRTEVDGYGRIICCCLRGAYGGRLVCGSCARRVWSNALTDRMLLMWNERIFGTNMLVVRAVTVAASVLKATRHAATSDNTVACVLLVDMCAGSENNNYVK